MESVFSRRMTVCGIKTNGQKCHWSKSFHLSALVGFTLYYVISLLISCAHLSTVRRFPEHFLAQRNDVCLGCVKILERTETRNCRILRKFCALCKLKQRLIFFFAYICNVLQHNNYLPTSAFVYGFNLLFYGHFANDCYLWVLTTNTFFTNCLFFFFWYAVVYWCVLLSN